MVDRDFRVEEISDLLISNVISQLPLPIEPGRYSKGRLTELASDPEYFNPEARGFKPIMLGVRLSPEEPKVYVFDGQNRLMSLMLNHGPTATIADIPEGSSIIKVQHKDIWKDNVPLSEVYAFLINKYDPV